MVSPFFPVMGDNSREAAPKSSGRRWDGGGRGSGRSWRVLALEMALPRPPEAFYRRLMANGAKAWSTGMISMELIFTWAGRVVAQYTASAMSSGRIGSVPW